MHCNKHWDLSCHKTAVHQDSTAKYTTVHVFLTSELFTTYQAKATNKNQDQAEAKQ